MRALLPTVPAKNVQEGQTASHLSSPSHQTMSCPSQHLLAPGLRWLACTPTPTGDLAGLQSEHRGTDPCSVTARTGPPWPQALESSAPPCSRQAAAPLPCLRPDLSPLTESIHSALPASLSLVSPMPLTPLDAVLSTMSVPGAVPRGAGAAAGWAHSSLLAAEISLEPTTCGRAPLPPGDVLPRAAPHTAPSFPLACPRGSCTGLGGLAGAAPIPTTKWIAVGVMCSGWGPCCVLSPHLILSNLGLECPPHVLGPCGHL